MNPLPDILIFLFNHFSKRIKALEDFLKLGIIDKAQLDNELDSFFSAPKMYNSQKLWLLFLLSKWCLRWEPKV